MKKRNKKYNPIKSVHVSNERTLKDYLIAQYSGIDGSGSGELKAFHLSGKEKTLSKVFQEGLSVFRYNWTVHLCVGTLNSKGEKEIKETIASPPTRTLYINIIDSISEIHRGMIDSLASKNVKMLFMGWVARPSGRELEPKELYDIFEKLGAW